MPSGQKPMSAPESICILRLSAIGDCCHTLPVVRTLQAHWPETHITWIIGRTEY
ncbi:MAG: glycosyl transferase, partial [Gammaproteobacteria bacterium]|nr:glycosyl transferase [Gammaproteobacteria bacterium]